MKNENLSRACGGAFGGEPLENSTSSMTGARVEKKMVLHSLPITIEIKTAKGVTAKVAIERDEANTCKQVTTISSTSKDGKPVVSVQVTEGEEAGGTEDDYLIGTVGIRGGKMKPIMATAEPRFAAPPPVTVTSSGLSLEALDRREVQLKKDLAKCQQERELLAIGRKELNKDINRHKMLMQASIEEANKQIAEERAAFVQALGQEMEHFKLPSLKRLINTDAVDALLSEAKSIQDECSKLCKPSLQF